MKRIFSALTLALALAAVTTAHAADKKIGNVIAVERTLDDVYNTCLDNLDKNHQGGLLSCSIEAKKNNVEFLNGYQRVLSLFKDGCEVEGAAQANVVMITFRDTRPKATADDSKACLRKALDQSVNKDSFKYTVFTIE